jgi:hypothetical protein
MRHLRYAAAAAALIAIAGCGSGSKSSFPTIGGARTYHLGNFEPSGPIKAGVPAKLAFTIVQPSGNALTRFRTGAGPHTGVHLIMVRSDLGAIIHLHPPVNRDGRIDQRVVFPLPGRYRVVMDAYPASGPQPNFQLFRWITVAGKAASKPLPQFRSVETVNGYRFDMHGTPRLRAIEPAFLTITVTGPNKKPAMFTPWFGALAHAIFFRAGTLDYFHTHVCSPGASGCTSVLGPTKVVGRSSTPGKLTVGVLVPVPGRWRLFLQVKVDGHVLTAPFTLRVS